MSKNDAVRRVIIECARRQTPPEISLSAMEEPLKSDCREYCAFIAEMLADMAERPLAYGMIPGAWEEYLAGRKENAAKRGAPARTLALRSTTMNSVAGYQRLLFAFGQAGVPEGDALRVPPEDYARILAEFEAKKKTIASEIPYATRLQALEGAGLRISACEDGGARVECARHPGMPRAMSALAKAAKNVKTYGEHNFQYCDFRQITSGHMQDWEDVIRPLSPEKRAVAEAIHALALACGMRASVTTYWKINYHYKGKHAACLDTDDGDGKRSFLVNHFRLRVDGSKEAEYLGSVSARGEEFQRYFERHMNYCTACSTSHVGRLRQAFGRTVRVCCCPTIGFRISDPGAGDLANIETVFRLRMEAIQNGWG